MEDTNGKLLTTSYAQKKSWKDHLKKPNMPAAEQAVDILPSEEELTISPETAIMEEYKKILLPKCIHNLTIWTICAFRVLNPDR